MNVLIITSIVVTVTLAIGTGLATIFVRLSNMVVEEQNTAEKEKTSYNPALTKGHKVAVEADFETQLKEARLLAAKKAAVTPRGANMRIGQLGEKSQPTAFNGIEEDPVTTVRVAHFHGWNILRTGAAAGAAAAGAVQATAAAPVQTKRPEDLVPGKDYEYIQITDSMDPAEIRRARIVNAKAKSAAVKALKASGATIAAGPAVVGAPAAAPAVQQQAAAQPQAVAVGGAEPVAGVDYEVIEITDDMDPAAVRKARINNSQAKAAAFKAFKESGGTVGAAAPAPVAQPAAAAPAAQPAAAAVPSSVPRPDFIEITDDMDPADIRKARINNAKAKSAYVKALKDAGIDPATVDMP